MRVLFVYIDHMQGEGGKYHEGLASLAAVLRTNGHSTRLIHVTDRIDVERFVAEVEAGHGDADMLAFSTTTNTFRHAADYANGLRRVRDVFTVFGGVHPTLDPAEVIAQPGVDAVCLGEGEGPLLELCDGLGAGDDVTQIPSLWIERDGEVHRNPSRPLVVDLDELPPPDRALFDYPNSVDHRMGRISFMGSRGCPYRCSYCCNETLRSLVPNPKHYVRFKSVDRLLAEMKQALQDHPDVEHLTLHDDILTLNRAWFAEFTERYPREIGLPYICNSRFDLLNETICEQLRRSGCRQVQLGLESGDEAIRNTTLNRRMHEDQILRAGELCHRNGLGLFLYCMVGIPGETLRTALSTVKLAARLRPAGVQTTVFYPYQGTALHEQCRADGFLTGAEVDSYFEETSVLRLDGFTAEEIRFAYRNFERTVHLYTRIFALRPPLGRLTERCLDHLWMHPGLFETVRPTLRALKAAARMGLGRGPV